MSFLTVTHLQKSYTDAEGAAVPVLKDVSFTLERGQAALVSGPSGCGKSTLLNIIAGLSDADDGAVQIDDTQICELSEAQRDVFRGKHIGYIVQNHNLLHAFSVADNLLIAAACAGEAVSSDDVSAALERVGLAGREADMPSRLSLGQQQRVAIARALITKPLLLLADEPTSSLDRQQADSCLDLMLNFAKETNMAVLMVSHDERVVDRFEQRWDFSALNNVDASTCA